MVQTNDLTFPSTDGIHDIHYSLWMPDGPVRAVVQLVHGVAEYVGRYDAYARYMTQNGIAVAGDDHLGHGRTIRDGKELGWFGEEKGWEHVTEDEKRLHDLLHERYPGVPMVLYGHSMGSFIARTYLGWHPDDFDACVLSGTGGQSPAMCAAARFLAGREVKKHGSGYRSQMLQKLAFGSYMKGIDDPISPNDWICRDPVVIRAYHADPLCGFTGTAGLMRDMAEGLTLIGKRSHLARMNKDMPVLFTAGSADPVGGWGKGVEKVAADFRRVGMRDVTVKLWPGMRHEIHNELGKEAVWQDTLDWINAKI